MPRSTLATPVADLTLTRTIAPDAIAIDLHDATGKPLYTERIALAEGMAPAEPPDPEQGI